MDGLSPTAQARLEEFRARKEARRRTREAFAARRARGLEARYRAKLGLVGPEPSPDDSPDPPEHRSGGDGCDVGP